MLRVLGRRGLEAGISLFAILGFCYVPLGSRTGLEHAKAVFGTAAAKRAGAELFEAFARVRGKLTEEAQALATGNASATPPSLPPPHHAAHPEHGHRATEAADSR
ncbi:MAG: hypothetical protein ABJB12_12325 [Pseudomonadota bacterium]